MFWKLSKPKLPTKVSTNSRTQHMTNMEIPKLGSFYRF
uniref:Uncharacterized protein n=1 Tax=Rhizophora mucronata TaxID=61149 RepID=A0A2P2N0G3_RHIMU